MITIIVLLLGVLGLFTQNTPVAIFLIIIGLISCLVKFDDRRNKKKS